LEEDSATDWPTQAIIASAVESDARVERRMQHTALDIGAGVDGAPTRLGETRQTMADEKPKKTRKTTTSRAPRKRASDQTEPGLAANERLGAARSDQSAETPVLAIEQSSELAESGFDDVDEIRRQAYELYLSRGCSDGGDLSDWLEAERIVRSRRGDSREISDRQRG
jgi:hypothetical protein